MNLPGGYSTARDASSRLRIRLGALGGALAARLAPPHYPPVLVALETHDNNYTAIRFVLAASVIYYHAFGLTDDPAHKMDVVTRMLLPSASLGAVAVDAFFFLSGLFVSLSYLKDPSVLHFVVKRFLRIWPGLFVCVATMTALAVLISQPSQVWRYLIFSDFYEHIVRNSTLRFEWTLDGVWTGRRYTSLNGSIHTLDPEARMYAILAMAGLVGALASRRRLALFGGTAAALTPLLYATGALNHVWAYADEGYIRATSFFAGVAVCGLAPRLRLLWPQGVVLLALTLATRGALHTFVLYAALFWTLLFVGQSRALRRVLRPRDDLSYGVYIYGWPATQMIVSFVSPHIDPYTLTALALALSCLFAAASWRFVEAPAISLGQALAKANFGFDTLRRSPIWPEVQGQATRLAALGAAFGFCVLAARFFALVNFTPVTDMPVRVVGYGPLTGRAGRGLNRQPDGHSAIWVNFEGKPEKDVTYVYVEGRRMPTTLYGDSATAAVDDDLLAAPGEKQVYLETVHFDRRSRSNSVWLHITK
jgi:peptidoglycan/LPS O-acetylase OafA/YrhL